MAKFKVNDRVAARDDPDRCGTVMNVNENAESYEISWDGHAVEPPSVGTRGEEELMPCPGSHTDQRLNPKT